MSDLAISAAALPILMTLLAALVFAARRALLPSADAQMTVNGDQAFAVARGTAALGSTRRSRDIPAISVRRPRHLRAMSGDGNRRGGNRRCPWKPPSSAPAMRETECAWLA